MKDPFIELRKERLQAKMKDIVIPQKGTLLNNIYASDCNPTKYGRFVRCVVRATRVNPGIYFELVGENGDKWMAEHDSFEVVK